MTLMKRKLRLLIVVLVFLFMISLIPPMVARDSTAIPWPTEGWETSTPEEQGVNSEALTTLLQSNTEVHTIMAIRHGKVILDVSRYPFTSSQPHALFSVTKSFVSTLVGIAIDKGYIKSIDQSIWDFFPKDKTANMDARKEAITLEDLLTQRSGISFDDLSIYKIADKNVTWAQFILDQPMVSEPGINSLLLDANTHLASAILQISTKMSTADFAMKFLFAPLGITDATWIADPQGVSQGGDHLYMSPASMAKLGYLYLHGGEWDGQQIVSSDWITLVTSTVTKGNTQDYGYSWWTSSISGTNHQVYAALGLHGQAIWVVPDSDLVVVTTNDSAAEGQTIINAIANASTSDQPLAPNPVALKALQTRLGELAHPKAIAVKPIPDAMKAVSGKVYQFQPNDFGWKSIAIDFTKTDEVMITLGLSDKEIKLPVGMDSVYRVSTDGLPAEPMWRPIANVPLMLRAGFLGKRFIVYMSDCMGMEFWTLNFDFSKDVSKLWIVAQSLNESYDVSFITHDLVGSS
ncbi:MAG: serine hydrolase [Anaerolineaceae bacterium]|nr:serine hydrolase [Anaerolineaceae bacterium]